MKEFFSSSLSQLVLMWPFFAFAWSIMFGLTYHPGSIPTSAFMIFTYGLYASIPLSLIMYFVAKYLNQKGRVRQAKIALAVVYVYVVLLIVYSVFTF